MGCSSSVPAKTEASAAPPAPKDPDATTKPGPKPNPVPEPAHAPAPSPPQATRPQPKEEKKDVPPASTTVAKTEPAEPKAAPKEAPLQAPAAPEPVSVPEEPKEPPADPELAAKVAAALQPLQPPECALLEEDGSGWDLSPILAWISDTSKKSRLCWLTRHRGDFASSLSSALVKHAAAPGAGFNLLHHYVRHNNVRTKDPILAIRSLAFQLFNAFPATLSAAYTEPCTASELDAALVQ
eukprot:CAMPEP_0117688772 /NCGR_PEP_ID=MMETSP0804-20121206/24053_1 /TAXON_ID=1074897 /ORGANISM="Tetraselmis astigmatica, Strain CCMP880" /LENGTH=238 /DNA_ID=CAMNT_0005501337 /DNA_START=74 /DNA_END=787 /DNA_ORIENTATION=-